MRVEQAEGSRGSLKWIQRAVNEHWPALDTPILRRLNVDGPIDWRSPLVSDRFAEYRDASFLAAIGCSHLGAALAEYWPVRGPQWDALGTTPRGDVLLVEAKAHVREMLSPGTQAGDLSRRRIEAALNELGQRLGAAADHVSWCDYFYQIANRLAHTDFLRRNGIPAWLVLVNFVGDTDMGGPNSPEAWEAAYQVAFHVMGLRGKNGLSPFILHVYPDVRLAGALST